jgi:hypothetical protein
MPRTLLIGSNTGVWREWMRANRGENDLLCLDPADSDSGFPARIAHYRSEKCVGWRFVGSFSALRSPHVLLAVLSELAVALPENAIVELFPYRPSPLRLQLARLCAAMVKPERILVDRRAQLEKTGWPASIEEIELPEPAPATVLQGHRKARWLQMIEQCESHELDLRHIAIDGLRLGSGVPIPLDNMVRFGFKEALHAEVAGTSLLIVSDAEVDDVEVSRALDSTHCSKAHVVSSRAYDNLLCSFADVQGNDFGLGRIERIAFPEMVAAVQCTAVPPAPVGTLRVGGLKVDSEGRELGELKPWEA